MVDRCLSPKLTLIQLAVSEETAPCLRSYYGQRWMTDGRRTPAHDDSTCTCSSAVQ